MSFGFGVQKAARSETGGRAVCCQRQSRIVDLYFTLEPPLWRSKSGIFRYYPGGGLSLLWVFSLLLVLWGLFRSGRDIFPVHSVLVFFLLYSLLSVA